MASIIVVGAGFAGMSTAVRLAKMRHEVRVIDASHVAGGRLRGIRSEGLSWPATPPAVTLPGVFRDLFRKSGRPMSSILDMQTAAPRRHVFLGRRETVTLDLPFGTRSAQHEAIMDVFGVDPWTGWVDSYADLWDVARRHVFEAVSTVEQVEALGARIGLRRSVEQSVRRDLRHKELSCIALDRWQHMGLDTKILPSPWNAWHYVERNFGHWRFDDDNEGLANALVQRMTERKVTLELETEVSGVLMKFGRVIGVQTAAGPQEADIVVWATGQSLPGLDTPTFPPRNLELTGVALIEDLLPADVVVHGRLRFRAWHAGHRRWVVAAPRGTDVLQALRPLGVGRADVVALTPLVSPDQQAHAASTSGSGLGLDLRHAVSSRTRTRASWIPRPAVAPVEGLYVVGGAAVPGSSLDLTGMGTSAVAAAIGPVPLVSQASETDSDEAL